jgi:hypothetical protein
VGAVTLTVPSGFLPLTCHFRLSACCRLAVGVAFVAGVLVCLGSAEGVGDALVGGVGLAVDAVRVDLEQDRDAVPGAVSDLGRRNPGVEQ